MLKIHGVPFSAHTRKVIVTALEKEIPYELVPVIPLTPPQGWTEVSPLGLIPAIQDGEVTLADSSVIGLYLEKKYPQRSLYPADASAFARALWVEEFVDSGVALHVLRGLLMQRVFAPRFLGQAPDQALIDKSLNEMIPARFGYLEKTLTRDWFAGDEFSIADIAVASIMINYHYAGEKLDARRYPKLAAFLGRALRRKSFRKAFETELPAASQIAELDLSLLRGLGD
jgi:glutathione S-transferase